MSFDNLQPARKPLSANNNAADKTRWLGRVRVLATEEQGEQEYLTTVAVWASSRENFDELLQSKMVSRHLRLQHSENAMPAVKWLYHYPNDYAAIELAQGICETWPIAFGEFVKAASANMAAAPQKYLAISEHSIPALPEQQGIPFWEKEWIAPALKELLFAQPDKGEPVYTYLVVDATLRKAVSMVFDLETVDVPVQCLLAGDEAQELKEVAPYLIDMSLPEGAWDDKDKVPNFHKDFFEHHWDQGTGVLLRTRATMEKLFRHLRRLTKYQGEDGKRYFFRFWETNASYDYFSCIASTPERAKQLFALADGHWIERWVSYSERMQRLYVIEAEQTLLAPIVAASPPFTVTPQEQQALMNSVLRPYGLVIQQYLIEQHPQRFQQRNERDLETEVFASLTRMHGYGFYHTDYLIELVEKDLILGGHCEDKDSMLGDILRANENEDQKFQNFLSYLSQHRERLTQGE